MEYFFGIVPPGEIEAGIGDFRKKFFSRGVLEPHITLLPPAVFSEDEIGAVKAVLGRTRPFSVSIGMPGIFDAQILFLEIFSDDLRRLEAELSGPAPAARTHPYHPHLTLGERKWGISAGDFSRMEEAARRLSFPAFAVSFVRLYERSDNGPWKKREDISLSGHA